MVLTRTDLRVARPSTQHSREWTMPKLTGPRIRAVLISFLAACAGITAGVAAAAGSGPFGGLRPHVTYAHVNAFHPRIPMDASKIFVAPKAQVIQQVVAVYDAPSTSTTRGASSSSEGRGHESEDSAPSAPAQPISRPMPPPTPPPAVRPSPSPEPDPTPAVRPTPNPTPPPAVPPTPNPSPPPFDQ